MQVGSLIIRDIVGAVLYYVAGGGHTIYKQTSLNQELYSAHVMVRSHVEDSDYGSGSNQLSTFHARRVRCIEIRGMHFAWEISDSIVLSVNSQPARMLAGAIVARTMRLTWRDSVVACGDYTVAGGNDCANGSPEACSSLRDYLSHVHESLVATWSHVSVSSSF